MSKKSPDKSLTAGRLQEMFLHAIQNTIDDKPVVHQDHRPIHEGALYLELGNMLTHDIAFVLQKRGATPNNISLKDARRVAKDLSAKYPKLEDFKFK